MYVEKSKVQLSEGQSCESSWNKGVLQYPDGEAVVVPDVLTDEDEDEEDDDIDDDVEMD